MRMMPGGPGCGVYQLLAIRTIAVHSAATYDRMAKTRTVPTGCRAAAGRQTSPTVPPGRQRGRRATRVPARRHRVLPDPDQHPHDHRRRGVERACWANLAWMALVLKGHFVVPVTPTPWR